MRLLLSVLMFLLVAVDASAEDQWTVEASPDPIIEVKINGEPVRLLVDPRLPKMMVLNPAARERLGITLVPLWRASFMLDGTTVRGRVARPNVRFPGRGGSPRVDTTVFGTPWAPDLAVDGAIGPTALPYDRIRIVLKEGSGGALRSFKPASKTSWTVSTTLLGEPALLGFDLKNSNSLVNRAAAHFLETQQSLTLLEEPRITEFYLGLSTPTQRGVTDAEIGGFRIGDVIARTDVSLSSDDGDVIVVTAPSRLPPSRHIKLGRSALATCYEILWDRRKNRLDLRCD
jgi:hypothetical protein